MLKTVPGILKYLYVKNFEGWLPIFRVMHLFQKPLYESEQYKQT